MPLDSNQPFHILDIETSGLSRSGSRGLTSVPEFLAASADQASFLASSFAGVHGRSQILQIYATGLPFYQPRPGWQGFERASQYAHTYLKPGDGYKTAAGDSVPFEFSAFTSRTGTLGRARKFGQLTEEQGVRKFFESLEGSIRDAGSARLGGWNILYDISGLETATYRYASLRNYRGFFQRAVAAQQLDIVSLEEPLLRLAHRFGEENRDFAERYLRMKPSGAVAQSFEDVRKVPGWSVENVARVLRRQFEAHEGVADVNEESQLYDYFQDAWRNVQAGAPIEEALRRDKQTARQFFEDLYDTRFVRSLEQQEHAGARILREVGEAGPELRAAGRRPLYVLGAAAGLAIAAGLAFGKRRDRQTQITGLDDSGVAALNRHKTTDFGSGWRGEEQSNTLPLLGGLLAAGGGYYGYRRMLGTPGGAEKLYRWARNLGEYSPHGFAYTFGFDAMASSYLVRELRYEAKELFYDGKLTKSGEHLERVLGRQLERGKDLLFRRAEGDLSPFLTLEGTGERVRFATQSKATAASFRLGRELGLDHVERVRASSQGSLFARAKDWFHELKKTQRLSGYQGGVEALIEGRPKPVHFQPLWRDSAGAKARVVSLELAERMQKLLSEIGLGLPRGSWNKAFHIPFAGEGGYVNELLFKRVLPAYLGWQALKFADAHLGHKPRDFAASLPLRANILRAELTDAAPGGRGVTDWYEEHVPGNQYGPLALPVAGAFAGGLVHYAKLLAGGVSLEKEARAASLWKHSKWGAIAGAVAMLPFLPGMLGSRKTAGELRAEYSGEEPVPIRSGRWWEVGTTPLEGSRVKYYRPHWYARMKSGADEASLYGSEEEGRKLNPLLHPLDYLRDPYRLEKEHYWDRPYPMASPAFSDVPLVGPILAATVGRLVKPPVRMHADEWSGDNYQLFGPRVEPRGPGALAPEMPQEEFSFGQVVNRELEIAEEYTGLPGYLFKSARNKMSDGTEQKPVYFQGSREMTSLSRKYYEKELGGVPFMTPEGEQFGYTEPLRRFIQREPPALNANEIPNAFAGVSWLPGEDYMYNLKTGDPYAKIQEGYLRLPGPGYESLNPEVAGLAPDDYPDWHKFKILADVAPYHTRFFQFASIAGREVEDDPERHAQYERIMARVEEQKASSIRVAKRRFSGETEQIEGTVKSASPAGVELEEYPGQHFTYSSVGLSAGDLAARMLGEQNRVAREQMGEEIESRQAAQREFIQQTLKPGTEVKLTLPKGASEHATRASAVIETGDTNVNRELIDRGLARNRIQEAGAEAQAMTGPLGNLLGSYSEAASFTGDSSPLNPLHWLPVPYHTKLWQERTALEQYRNQEVYGSRQRRWDTPSDFLGPYFRGMSYRLTGKTVAGGAVDEERDLNTLEDQLTYLRALSNEIQHPDQRGRHALAASRTNVGADLAGASPEWAGRTLPRRERYYFAQFAQETDPDQRAAILESVAPETARALSALWVGRDVAIRKARGEKVPAVTSEGRVVTEAGLDAYESADTELGYGDFERSQEIAEFFHRRRLRLPETGDAILSGDLDYEDVKLKIIQNEGWDYHDFNIFNDRASTLWRKPYLDGAVRELTSGTDESLETLRRSVERMMIEAGVQGQFRGSIVPARENSSSVTVSLKEKPDREILRDVRRNPDDYED